MFRKTTRTTISLASQDWSKYRRLRFGWAVLVVLVCGIQPLVQAQTVRFTSAVSLLDNTAYSPMGVAVDGLGNVFIADTANSRVLEVATGVQSVPIVIEAGLNAPERIAVDSSGDLYISDSGNNRILKETPAGSGYTQTTVASGLSGPIGVAVDGVGNIYVADVGNNRILEEIPSSGSYTQTAILSNLSYPRGYRRRLGGQPVYCR